MNALKKIFEKIQARIRPQHREPLFIRMLLQACRESRALIEIGSSDGTEAIEVLRKSFLPGGVYILEPDQHNIEIAKKNIAEEISSLASRVKFFNVGASNHNETKEFYRCPERPHLNSAKPTEFATQKMTMTYTSLSSFLAETKIEGPLVVKMDIEGHEVEVLEGFLEYITQNSGIKILMELHPKFYSEEHSLENILKKYFDLGFTATLVESATLPEPDAFKGCGFKPIKIADTRALYENIPSDFVLKHACSKQNQPIDRPPFVAEKIIRSILIEKAR